MVRGQYAAGTGMMLQRRQMEIITNNITNADTAGYKKEYLVSHSFDNVLLTRINDSDVSGQTRQIGSINMGTQVDQLYIDFKTGGFENTDRNTDFALEGDVFFVMQTPNGERYTSSGAFYVDSTGYLTDGDGNYVLSESGPIYVGGTDFAVDESGDIRLGAENIGRMRVVSFADNNVLRKEGGNLYFALEEPEQETKEYKVKQGFVENSNVEIAREMVDMLAVYRVYETNQRMLTMIDETVGKAVNEIGRLR